MILKLLEFAKENGLFDFEWFCDYYNLNFPDELSAFKYYIKNSIHTNINPSRKFCTKSYIRNNIDIFRSEISPLEHYIKYGLSEGRRIYPAENNFNPYNENLFFSIKDKNCGQDYSIAVVLHIFYDDFIDRFSNALLLFPSKIDLYITTISHEMKLKVERVFSQINIVNGIKVKVVPNRGRNFGPFLVEYSDDILRYDLMIHLHSKKSLYSGTEQFKWANYMIDYLISNNQIVESVFKAFKSDPKIGIYYPTSFKDLPLYANHWLKNFAEAKINFPNLNISNTFLAYPTGGMFWAKPIAIKQLLESNFTYDSFPEEPLPNDGSYVHTIERIISPLCESNGFKQLFYYPERGIFSFSDEFILGDYFSFSYEHLYENCIKHKSVSLDLFDTLFIRKYYFPDLAKKNTALRLFSENAIKDVRAFVEDRNKAEFRVREDKSFNGDVSIIESYNVLLNKYNDINYTSEELSNIEFNFDLQDFIVRDELVFILNRLEREGIKIYFITDSYYTLEQIELILRYIGIDVNYELLVSSDIDMRKDNGELWDYLVKRDSLGNMHLHVGDNMVSDIQIPGDFGLHVYPLLNPIDKWRYLNRNLPDEIYDMYNNASLFWGRKISIQGFNPFFIDVE